MRQALSYLMRGIIPSELELLIKLNYLSLGQNLLTGNIPNELGQLTNLNWLALEYELFDWRCSH
jgi:Leucine-rich repeat (LRR) protein